MNFSYVMSFKKKVIGILVLSVLLSVIYQPNRVVFADVFTSFDGGIGTVGDPYLISRAVQLNEIRENVTASYKLTDNINLSDYTNWVPIGSITFLTRFKGSLDGNGHTITNLTINRPTTDYVGLFGYIHAGTIKNLRIAGASITGQSHVGVLAGRIEGEFEGQQATISNSGSSGGSVTGSSYVGGLVGSSLRGRIDNSYSSVSVIGTAYDVGGLLGSNGQGTISYSYATGNVISPLGTYVGGLVGSNNAVSVTSPQSLIEMSYATGEVQGKNDVGGLLGLNDSRGLASSNTNVRDSYAGGEVTGIDRVGGLVGYNYNGLIDNGYALGEVIGTIQVGGLVGHRDTDTINTSYYDRETTEINAVSDFSRSTELMKTLSNYSGWAMGSTWGMDNGINDGYPYLLASSLSAVATQGQGADTTMLNTAAGEGNHLVVQVSSSARAVPGFGHAVPTSAVLDPYIPGSDIGGVDATTNKYVSIFEANSDNKVVKFAQIIVQREDILTYSIDELHDQSLAPLMVGYSTGTQVANTITVTSTGTGDLANLTTEVSGDAFDTTQPVNPQLDSTTPSTTFEIQAKDGLGEGTYTETVTISADHMSAVTFTITQVVSALGAPALQTPAASNGQVTINWSPVAAVTGYSVFMTTTPGTYGLAEATVSSATYSYNATGLINGTSYYFTVRANNNGVDGAASNEVSATPKTVPGAPTAVTATTASGQATVGFVAPTSNGGSSITSYKVIASPGNQSATGATSPIVITGLSNGTSYTFTVIATNSEGDSPSSTPSSAVTHPIGVPVLQAPTIGDAQLVLDWGAVNDVTGYRIYRSTVPGTYGAALDSVSSNTLNYTVTGLANGTTYYFTIKAINSGIEGAASNEESAIPVRWSGPGAPSGTFAGGIGIEENPYLIATADQLNEVRYYLTGSYKLIDNIDLSSYASSNGWEPIGTGDFALSFSGNMDGDGYSIRALRINRPSADHVGLFGYVSGSITNLKLDNVDIVGNDFVGAIAAYVKHGTISNSTTSGVVSGNEDVGGLVGRIWPGKINNSNNSSSVTGYYRVGGVVGSSVLATIRDSYSSGNVTGINNSFYVGGLVGYLDGAQATVENSFASGNVTANSQVGGLVGNNINGGRIETSYSIGNVNGMWLVGGLVGYNVDGVIRNSYTKSIVNGQSGYIGGYIGDDSRGDVMYGYATGPMTGAGANVNGFIGDGVTLIPSSNFYDTTRIGLVDSHAGTPTTTTLMKTQGTYTGWDFTQTWGINSTINDGYPYLRYLAPVLVATADVGDASGTTKITAAADFGNHLVIKVSSSQFTIPSIRNMVSESEVINPYVSGTDISGVDAATNKYVAVYEVDNDNQVLKFTQITLTSNDIQPSYAIEELADLTMTQLTVGYAPGTQQTKTVAITRTGTEDLAGLAVTISGTDYEVTQPAITTLTSGTPSTSFTVRAKDGLTAGTYTATVTVSADHMTNETFTVTQVVRQARPSIDPPSIDPPGTTIIVPALQTTTKATIDLGDENTGAIMYVEAEVKTSADGTTSSNVVVDHDQFVQMLNSIQSKETAVKSITVAVEGKVDRLNVEIPIAAIGKEVGVNTNAYLIIETDLAAYRIPLSLLGELSTNLGGNLSITMNQLSGQLYDSMYKAAERQELLILNNPIEFKLSIKDQEIIDFGDIYVERLVRLGSEVDLSKATAVWYDPATEIFHFVPAIFNEIGEATNIVMKSPHNSIYTLVQSNKTFSDLHGHWAKDDIEKLAFMLIVSGKSATEFVPNAKITRAEFVALLVRSLGIAVTDAKSSFQDVNENAWFTDEIEAAVKAGLVRGFTDDTFHPEHLITREQIAIIMAAALEYVDSQLEKSELVPNLTERFSDADQIHSWARNAATISIKAGIISGRTEATFAPIATATRAEAVTMLARMLRYIQFIN